MKQFDITVELDEKKYRAALDRMIADLKALIEKEYTCPVTPYPLSSSFSGRTREAIVQAAADCLEQMWIDVGLSKPKAELIAIGASANGDGGADDEAAGDEAAADAADGS